MSSACACKDPVEGKNSIRTIGIVCIAIGFIQFIVGLVAQMYSTNVPWGAWWVGLILVITGGAGLKMDNECLKVTAMILGYIGLVVAITGAVIDGAASNVMGAMTTCINNNGVYFGSSDNALTALGCQNQYGGECACVTDYNWDGDNESTCSDLDGTLNCDIDLDTLPGLLGASSFFCALSALVVMILACCVSCFYCCPDHPAEPAAGNGIPVVVVTANVMHTPEEVKAMPADPSVPTQYA